jgi:hypothetical protein
MRSEITNSIDLHPGERGFWDCERVTEWGGKNTNHAALSFCPIFIPLFGAKVSGVSVQDMRLRLSFLTPEH